MEVLQSGSKRSSYVMESKSNLPLFFLTDLDSINGLWKDLFDVVMRIMVAEVAQKLAIE